LIFGLEIARTAIAATCTSYGSPAFGGASVPTNTRAVRANLLLSLATLDDVSTSPRSLREKRFVIVSRPRYRRSR
jgi:hypothetical protein